MTVNLANLSARAMADAFTTHIGASPLIRIYAGTVPTDADTALSGNTLLATCPMSATPFPAATDGNPGGVLTANAITSDSAADATGTATFGRLLTSGATAKMQFSVGTSGTDCIFNTVAFVINAQIDITSFVLTQPE